MPVDRRAAWSLSLEWQCLAAFWGAGLAWPQLQAQCTGHCRKTASCPDTTETAQGRGLQGVEKTGRTS